MRYKYYQFHYAEKIGTETHSLGILQYKSLGSATKELFIQGVRDYLQNPTATIIITHVTKLTKSEYAILTGKKSV